MRAVRIGSADDLRMLVEEHSARSGKSPLVVMVAVLQIVRREQERCADDQERVRRLGRLRRIVVEELQSLWAARLAARNRGE